MFQLKKIRAGFSNKPVLFIEDMSFSAGSLVALMGPNGAGKTTLLHLLASLLKPIDGDIFSDTNTTVAYLSQQNHISTLPLTVKDALTMGRYRERKLLGRIRKKDRALIQQSADRLQVQNLMKQSMSELSGGERQRVRIASMLVNNASCLLLDEPITGLDLHSQGIIFDIFKQEKAAGKLIIISSHHVDEVLKCDRIIALNKGQVIADGIPEDILTEENLSSIFGVRLLPVDHDCDNELSEKISAFAIIDEHGHGDEHSYHNESECPDNV